MGSQAITIVAFGSISMAATAMGLLLKDLIFGSRQATRRSLRRRRNAYDRPAARTVLGRIDRGFDRLVLESGVDASPMAAFMLLIASALAIGGGLFVYSNQPLHGIGGAILGLLFPLMFFAVKRRRRFQEIRKQLPGAIDILARATRAGRSLEQAIELAAEESKGIIADELVRLDQSLQMGSAFDSAVKAFAQRLPIVEVRILATTLMVQRQSGGHLSETLERMASVIRERLAIQGQIQAATGAGRLSTAVIAALAPTAFIIIMVINPDHVETLMNDLSGRYLMAIGVGLEVIGLLWVLWLIKNEG